MHHLTIQSYFCGCSIARSPNYLGIIRTKQFDVERNTRQDPLRWSYWLSGEMYSQFEARFPMISDRFKFRPDPHPTHPTLAPSSWRRGSRVAAARWAGDAPLASPAEGPRWGVGWTLDGTLRLHAQWPACDWCSRCPTRMAGQRRRSLAGSKAGEGPWGAQPKGGPNGAPRLQFPGWAPSFQGAIVTLS